MACAMALPSCSVLLAWYSLLFFAPYFLFCKQIKSEVLLANWHLSADRRGWDIIALVIFIFAALMSTFAVLYNSKYRR
jgi:hypothetical protein